MAAPGIIMVRPASFKGSDQSMQDNAFQLKAKGGDEVQKKALDEFNRMVSSLREKHVSVTTFDDTLANNTPDSIFPNNWFSTHENGLLITYPMKNEDRRAERRPDILDALRQDYQVNKTVDFARLEEQEVFLEGTGSMVLDHQQKVAYMCISDRSLEEGLTQFCQETGYAPCAFHASFGGKPIYHTNVMMSVGENWILACLDAIDEEDKPDFLKKVEGSGKEFIPITLEQMQSFLGNCIEVLNEEGEKILLLSQTAYDSLKNEQKATLETWDQLLPISIPTIEAYGGGSIRCMVAENYLEKR